jgi:hypothetical protein
MTYLKLRVGCVASTLLFLQFFVSNGDQQLLQMNVCYFYKTFLFIPTSSIDRSLRCLVSSFISLNTSSEASFYVESEVARQIIAGQDSPLICLYRRVSH